jgi:hypothetical protein
MRFPWQPPSASATHRLLVAAADVISDNSVCYGKQFPFSSFILLHSLCFSLPPPFVSGRKSVASCLGRPLRRIQLVSPGAGPRIVPACDQQVGLSLHIKMELVFGLWPSCSRTRRYMSNVANRGRVSDDVNAGLRTGAFELIKMHFNHRRHYDLLSLLFLLTYSLSHVLLWHCISY